VREIPAALQSVLDAGIMTNSDVFLVTLLDGTRLGFSSVDIEITVDGVVCLPTSGFTPSTYDATLGAETDGTDIEGILDDETITENDIHRGRWDGATVEQWLADWQTGDAVMLHRQTLAEIERQGGRFVAQLRSAASALEDEQGVVMGSGCPYALGDASCGVSLSGFTANGTITASGDDWIEAATFSAQADGWYDDGSVTFASGGSAQVQRHEGNRVTFWRPLSVLIETGEAITAIAGCAKTWGVCRSKFGNGDNFGGFPHIPGQDSMFQAGSADGAPSNVPVVLSDGPITPTILTAVGDGDGSATVTFSPLYATVESRGDGSASSVHGLDGTIRIGGLTPTTPGGAAVTQTITLVSVVGTEESAPASVTVTMPEAWPQSGGGTEA